jgi:hypothetical protein
MFIIHHSVLYVKSRSYARSGHGLLCCVLDIARYNPPSPGEPQAPGEGSRDVSVRVLPRMQSLP